MLRSSQKRRKCRRANVCEGEVWTTFDRAVLGGIVGTRFDATLDWKNSTIKVQFLVRDKALAEFERDDVIMDYQTHRVRANPIKRVLRGLASN